MKPAWRKLLVYALASLLSLALLGAVAAVGLYAYLTPRLPSIEALKDVRLQVPLRVYARDGGLIAEFGEMKRTPLRYDEFPPRLVQAVLAAEDDRFFEHPGVDYQGILRAAFHLLRTGERAQGGSTITMQVARNFFLSREKTFLRKLNEILLALKIEKELTKEQILELYLNKIYLGKRAYGFAAAAQVYYGRPLARLELHQLAMIAGLPKAPSRYNPIANPERALARRNYVLGRMHEMEFIDDAEYEAALAAEDDAEVHGLTVEVEAPYVAEMVRAAMLERFGPEAYTAGYRVYTTVDPRLQAAAVRALRDTLLEYGRRHGYRGPAGHVDLDALPDDPEAWEARLEEVATAGDLVPALVLAVDDDAAWAWARGGRLVHLPFEARLKWAARYVDDTHTGPAPAGARDVLKEGDLILVATREGAGCAWLAEIPEVGGALVALRPDDGAVLALVGGFDFYRSKFNRAAQARRQPGSSFKPFIYAAAIDKGFTAASIINDAPVVFEAPGLEDTWRPENYTGRFYGPTRLRKALVNSRNLVSIRLLRDIGIGYAVRYVRRFGFSPRDLPRDLSLALGSGALTPLELAAGYAVFANGGHRVTPWFINRVVGPDGRVVMRTVPQRVCEGCRPPGTAAAASAPAAGGNGDGPADPAQAGPAAPEAAPGQEATAPPAAAAPGPEPAPATASEEAPWAPPLPPGLEPGGLALLPSPEPAAGPEAGGEDTAQQPGEAPAAAAAGTETAEARAEAESAPAVVPPLLVPAPRVLSPQTAFLMNSMLRDVIRHGTGRRALALGRSDLAGKTGTTNDQQDAWFSGFTRNTVATAWVGFDNPRPLGDKETGARAALPMWMRFMAEAVKGEPETPLVQPPGMVTVRIDAATGLPAGPETTEAVFEYFLADQVPQVPAEGEPRGAGDGQEGEITQQLF